MPEMSEDKLTPKQIVAAIVVGITLVSLMIVVSALGHNSVWFGIALGVIAAVSAGIISVLGKSWWRNR